MRAEQLGDRRVPRRLAHPTSITSRTKSFFDLRQRIDSGEAGFELRNQLERTRRMAAVAETRYNRSIVRSSLGFHSLTRKEDQDEPP